MTWNYRIIVDKTGDYGIYEVYYDDNLRPVSHTVFPTGVHGDSKDELLVQLGHMLIALEKPILTHKDFELTDE